MWYDQLFSQTPTGKRSKLLVSRLHEFSNKIIEKRIAEFRKLSKTELEEMGSSYASGKVKRELAFLDTLLYAMEVTKGRFYTCQIL